VTKTLRTLSETQSLVSLLKQTQEIPHDNIIDEEENDILIYVKRKDASDTAQKFKLWKTDPFSKVIDVWTKMNHILIEDCTLKFSGMPVSFDETPKDCCMMNQDCLEVIVTSKQTSKLNTAQDKENINTENDGLLDLDILPIKRTETPIVDRIKLKVRLGNTEPLKFQISKTDSFQKLFVGFCSKSSLDLNTVKFMFDGIAINSQSTPNDLEMEDDDLIDAAVK